MVTHDDYAAYLEFSDNWQDHVKILVAAPLFSTLLVLAIVSIPLKDSIFDQTIWENWSHTFVLWPTSLALSIYPAPYTLYAITGEPMLISLEFLAKLGAIAASIPPIVFITCQCAWDLYPIPFTVLLISAITGIALVLATYLSMRSRAAELKVAKTGADGGPTRDEEAGLYPQQEAAWLDPTTLRAQLMMTADVNNIVFATACAYIMHFRLTQVQPWRSRKGASNWSTPTLL